MAKIVLAWEMGGEYGHISRLKTFGDAFKARGHEVCYVLKDLSRAEIMIGAEDRIYQAPHWVPTVSGLPPPTMCAETLIRFGYLEPEGLTGLCRAWRNLYTALAPDLLFCDFAPTALLAARGTDIPTAVSDTGYGIPPARSPLAPYRWWLKNPPPPLAGAEARVLECINTVTKHLDAPPYQAVHEVFRAATTFLCTYEELDHYPEREPARYWGTVANLESGAPAPWPSGKGPRVFVYLRPDCANLMGIQKALSAMKARTVAFVPGIDEGTRKQLASRKFVLVDRPLRIDAVRTQCDAAICHAGVGTTAALLVAGKPVLLLPTHTEQMMVAMRVKQLGAGLVADNERPSPVINEQIATLLNDTGLRAQAKKFAQRYRDRTQGDTIAEIAAQCENVIGAGPN